MADLNRKYNIVNQEALLLFHTQVKTYSGPEGSKQKNKLKMKKQIENEKTNSKRENKF